MGRFAPTVSRFFLAFFAIVIGLYPVAYVVAPGALPYWSSKSALNGQTWWLVAFYAHILGGGVAMLLGWMQFLPKWQARRIGLHRLFGKIYVASILLFGATGGFVVALFANGGFPSALGFGTLAVLWFVATLRAWTSIRRKDVESHKAWMIRSYALTFAAVTLRLWLPLFTAGFGLPFEQAYIAIAWWCWVPNLIVGEYLVGQLKKE
jgi:uncharacterized membrane protein